MKMKRIVTTVIVLCLLLCTLSIVPEKKIKAESTRLNARSITIGKGQCVRIVVKGKDASEKITWSVSGKSIKVCKTTGRGNHDYDGNPCCYVEAVGAGTGTLKCTAGKKIIKCKIKVLADAAFVGDFVDGLEDVHLSIVKSGKEYRAVYRHFRLCTMDNLEGTVKNGVLTLKGLDPAGKPITVTLSKKGKKRVLTFKKTTWDYFTQGDAITLKKCSKDDKEKAELIFSI